MDNSALNNRLETLMEKLKKDKRLAHKLDLLEEISKDVDPNTTKRKHVSPIKTRKVVKLSDGSFSAPLPNPRCAGKPDVLGLEQGSDKCGTSTRDVLDVSYNPENLDDSDISESEEPIDSYSSLEQMILDDHESDKEVSDLEENEESFNILGKTPSSAWSPAERVLKFYLKIADLELSKEVLSELSEEFKTNPDLDNHFTPPKFPPSFWELVQKSSSDLFKLKALFKIQENLFLALKPLLSCLENCPKESKDNLTKAIQLIATSNLNLNRFRRITIAPFLKTDIKKQILSLPVKHDSFFGDDFAKSSDTIIKEQATLEKIIHKPFPKRQNFRQKQEMPHNSNRGKFFRGSGRGRYNKSRGGKKFGTRRPFNPSQSKYHNNSQSTSNQY